MGNWIWAGLAFFALATTTLPAGALERGERDPKYTWDLGDLFPSREAWRARKAEVQGRFKDLEAARGHLGDSPEALYRGLETYMELKKETVRLFVYAMQLSDEDTRVAENAALKQEAEQLMNALHAAGAFLDPEVLSLGKERVAAALAAEPRLKDYRPFLEDILRRAAHTRSPEVEQVLARAGDVLSNPDTVYSLYSGAELPYPEAALSDGTKVTLDPSAFAKYRASSDRADRLLVFRKFFQAHDAVKGTLGALLYGQVMAHKYVADARGYGSCVEAALDENAIPVAVYERLLKDVRANLPTLHRYLRLRQRMMGLEQLRYEDLYAPTVRSVEMNFTPEEAMALTLAAFAPLGTDYVGTLKHGYESRWVDWFPSPGKRSGAYSEGAAYDVHPYQLLNFNGRYADVSTLAHESGHSMHYYLSNRSQPYATSEHATFVAEVASTFNESLLFRYMLAHAKDDDTRLFLLNARVDAFRQTLFRQTLFAEFELAVHRMAERGEPITGESLSKLYLGLVRTYYGHDDGVCQVDDYCGAEWGYIHHFWAYNFYVYQYATSLTASAALSKAVREEEARVRGRGSRSPRAASARARDAYLKLLSSGCSKYPIALLQDAGVYMTTSAPFDAAMAEMNEIMDQMEEILARRR